eukprot:gene12214-biopygen1894
MAVAQGVAHGVWRGSLHVLQCDLLDLRGVPLIWHRGPLDLHCFHMPCDASPSICEGMEKSHQYLHEFCSVHAFPVESHWGGGCTAGTTRRRCIRFSCPPTACATRPPHATELLREVSVAAPTLRVATHGQAVC